MLLRDRVAVVTGAGRGLGAAIAAGFATEGAKVVLVDVDGDAAARNAQSIDPTGAKAWGFGLDVTDRDALKDCALKVSERFGQVSTLVNSAGIAPRVSLEDSQAIDTWDKVLAVNLDGTFFPTLAFLPALKQSKGTIVNIASINAFVSGTSSAGYTAAKGGVRSLTQYLAKELARYGVRVNALAPGVIATELTAARRAESGAQYLQRVPMGRFGDATDVVGPALFLSSDMSAYITGVTLPVDGGFLSV